LPTGKALLVAINVGPGGIVDQLESSLDNQRLYSYWDWILVTPLCRQDDFKLAKGYTKYSD